MYVPASVRRSSARRISALDSPSIRRTRFQNSKAKPRFPKQNRDFRGQDGLVARGFDDITRFFTKHKISIPAPTLASPPNQTRKQCSAPPTHQRMHRHRPPDHHVISRQGMHIREFPVVLLTVPPPPRVDRCAQGGSLSTRASRPALPLSLQRSFFPHGFPPSSSPLLRRGHTTVLPREGDERYFRYFV